MNNGQSVTRFFVSHSTKDDLDALLNAFREADVRVDEQVFYAKANLANRRHEEFLAEIKLEIAGCSEFVVLYSESALTSDWVNYEIGTADALGKRIHVVLTQSTDRRRLPLFVQNRTTYDSEVDFKSWLLTPVSVRAPAFRVLLHKKLFENGLLYSWDAQTRKGRATRYLPAVRLYGADLQVVNAERLRLSYEHLEYELPSHLQEAAKKRVDTNKRRAEAGEISYFDGANIRLLSCRTGVASGIDEVTETETLALHLGPIGWFDYDGSNAAMMERSRGWNDGELPSEAFDFNHLLGERR
jgi:MTH538 TIR-like domain (DUF1863)